MLLLSKDFAATNFIKSLAHKLNHCTILTIPQHINNLKAILIIETRNKHDTKHRSERRMEKTKAILIIIAASALIIAVAAIAYAQYANAQTNNTINTTNQTPQNSGGSTTSTTSPSQQGYYPYNGQNSYPYGYGGYGYGPGGCGCFW